MKSTLKVLLILLLPLMLAALVLFFAVRSQYRNGERIIYGYEPLPVQTLRAEDYCNQIPLPPQSRRLHTEITSKKYIGSVTSNYSTDLSCTEVDDFFGKHAASRDWKFRSTSVEPSFFGPNTQSTYTAEAFEVYVSCKGMKSFRGERIFYLSCSWRSD